MKDKLKITYAEDGHKVVKHSKPIKRQSNYWQRRAGVLNMPVVFYLIINAILLFLVITAIICIL